MAKISSHIQLQKIDTKQPVNMHFQQNGKKNAEMLSFIRDKSFFAIILYVSLQILNRILIFREPFLFVWCTRFIIEKGKSFKMATFCFCVDSHVVWV